MGNHNIPENVVAFLDRAAAKYGKEKETEFHQDLWGSCSKFASPIEQLFLIGLSLVSAFNCKEAVVMYDGFGKFGASYSPLQVVPQMSVGKYHVDFAIRHGDAGSVVCIELDGHNFHDRDEKQRRYEKQRDRYLVSNGYQVLHFTGSEVVRDPCKAGLEAFILATGLKNVATHPFEDA